MKLVREIMDAGNRNINTVPSSHKFTILIYEVVEGFKGFEEIVGHISNFSGFADTWPRTTGSSK
jgi:hypothetical protein